MTGLLCLIFLTTTLCGRSFGSFVLQSESTVLVKPGLPTSLKCHILRDGQFSIFWIKIPLNKAPVCVATAKAFVNTVETCEQFKKHSRIKATWNQQTFNLSFSSVEQSDVATYFCGTLNYGQHFFGNGSKLVLEEHADAVSLNTTIQDNQKKQETEQVFEYLVVALAATNVASVILIISLCRCLKKNKSALTGVTATGVSVNYGCPKDGKNTDEVNYAALNFGNKQRRTVEKRTNAESAVLYGAIQCQEEI